MGPCRPEDCGRTVEVNLDEPVELLLSHVAKRAEEEDACVVDDDVEAPEAVDGALDHHSGFMHDIRIVRYGLTSRLRDLGDHLIGRSTNALPAFWAHPGVVDDELTPTGRKGQGVG